MTHEEILVAYADLLLKIMKDTPIDLIFGATALHYEFVRMLHNTSIISEMENIKEVKE